VVAVRPASPGRTTLSRLKKKGVVDGRGAWDVCENDRHAEEGERGGRRDPGRVKIRGTADVVVQPGWRKRLIAWKERKGEGS